MAVTALLRAYFKVPQSLRREAPTAQRLVISVLDEAIDITHREWMCILHVDQIVPRNGIATGAPERTRTQ